MPTLFWIFLCYFGTTVVCQGQANPCHCLSFGLDFHEGAEELEFVPLAPATKKNEKLIQVYQEQKVGRLTAVAVLSSPSSRNSPVLEELYWQNEDTPEIAFHAAWDFDLKAAYRRRAAFVESQKKDLAELPPFQFLPPMNNTLHLQVYLLEDYQKEQWPLPKEAILMKVKITIPAHPFYSDWNAQSPFHMQTPHLKLKLTYIEGYQWDVIVEDGLRIVQQLMPL